MAKLDFGHVFLGVRVRLGEGPAHIFYLNEVLGARGYVETNSTSAAVTAGPGAKLAVCVYIAQPASAAENEVILKMLSAISISPGEVLWQIGEFNPVQVQEAKVTFGLRFGDGPIEANGLKFFELPSLSDILGVETSGAAKKLAWQQLKLLRQEMDA